MASTTCFFGHLAPLGTSSKPLTSRWMQSSEQKQMVSRGQKIDRESRNVGEGESVAMISRRLAMSLLIGSAAAAVKASPAEAAYGEPANVFGKPKTKTDFLPYNGDGFQVLIPSKWNPSKEVEYPGQVLRYEDNFDSTSNLAVIITPTDKKSITDFGSPEQFLSQVDFLLGKQAFFGKTYSEGGFDPDSVATANILETSTPVVDGKKYYYLSILTRTADGDEGGKHQLIMATVSDGKLYICKAQAGDKRWFKGARRFVENAASSFRVA